MLCKNRHSGAFGAKYVSEPCLATRRVNPPPLRPPPLLRCSACLTNPAQISTVYRVVNEAVTVTYTPAAADPKNVASLLSTAPLVASHAPPGPVGGGATFLFAGVGFAVLSPLDVTLDGATLAKILGGEITAWSHPDIAALNPGGIACPDAAQRIVLYNSPVVHDRVRAPSPFAPAQFSAVVSGRVACSNGGSGSGSGVPGTSPDHSFFKWRAGGG